MDYYREERMSIRRNGMTNNPLPQAKLDLNDALFLVPILTSYGAWVRQVCPFKDVVKLKMATIESLQTKLSGLQERRDENIEGIIVFMTADEVETMTSSLKCFHAHAPKLLARSPDRDALL